MELLIKKVAETTSQVSPQKLKDHFEGLIGPKVQQSTTDEELVLFVE